jgi:hypothetical protein
MTVCPNCSAPLGAANYCAKCGLSFVGWPPNAPTVVPPPLPKEIVAKPVEAWRLWRVYRQDGLTLDPELAGELADDFDKGLNPFRGLFGPRLHAIGVAGGYRWPRIAHGECRAPSSPDVMFLHGQKPQHSAPDPACRCGVWAFHDLDQLWPHILQYHGIEVYGRVQMWGRLIEHKAGWRAEYAKPVELFLIDWLKSETATETAAGLADYYGCPVHVVDEPEQLAEIQKQQAAAREAEVRKTAVNAQNYTDWIKQLQSSFVLQQHSAPGVLVRKSVRSNPHLSLWPATPSWPRRCLNKFDRYMDWAVQFESTALSLFMGVAAPTLAVVAVILAVSFAVAACLDAVT